jgi:putative ABC transport system permease protein
MHPWRQGFSLMWRFLGRGRSRPASILLAVAWGTMSMMLLLAFGKGLAQQMGTANEGLGRNLVILSGGNTTKGWQGLKPGRYIPLEEEDLQSLTRSFPEMEYTAAEMDRWAVDLRWGTKSASTHLTGVMPCFEVIRTHHPRPGGRFINDLDQAAGRRVVFLGPKLKERIFGPAEAVGQTLYIRGIPFTVIGVMVNKQQNSMYGGPDVEKASIPLSAFESIFGRQPYSRILYTVKKPWTTQELEPRVRELLARRHKFDPEDKSALFFWDTVKMRETGAKIFRGMEIFLGIVGAMTMLVAGVGLANMLFVMVQRRTREIGLMMALGARRPAISSQIVGEALILAGIGGYLGIGLSWLLVELLHRIPVQSEGLQFLGKPTLSVPLGLVTVAILAGIGCLAGWLPSRRASRLNPVEALRHE